MRNKTIDFLRGIAILLTLFRHLVYNGIFEPLKQVGWIGVDLFFVLSGFLVSGLIFDEYAKTNNFDGKRFLIRRGFKIYPAFWIFIICLIIYEHFVLKQINYSILIKDLFFIQNYFYPNDHTWSLAVEEHFYFLIVILFLITIRYAKNKNRTILIGSVMVIIYGIIAKAALFFINPDFKEHTHIFPTHLRIDSLMIGLLIAHIWRTRQDIIDIIVKHKYIMYAIAMAGLTTPFIWSIDKNQEQRYIASIGLTCISISFGLILILFLKEKNFEKNLSKIIGRIGLNTISKIGFYSYSIYLWHVLVRDIMYQQLHKQGDTLNGYLIFIIYMSLSIGVGIALGKLIEIPFLNLRDRYFPKKV